MVFDPYQILGVRSDATDEEIKKAYRQLSRKYHPDANINNPNKDQAEEMFKQVQQAYDQIMKQREQGSRGGAYGPGSSYGNPYRDSGDSQYREYDGFGGFNGFGFGPFGFGFSFGGQQGYEQSGPRSERFDGFSDEESGRVRAAINYINSGYYPEALNILNNLSGRSAFWYYLSAVANSGAGNNVTAEEHARMAVQLEPDNTTYQSLLYQFQNGGSRYANRGTVYGRSSTASSLCTRVLLSYMLCMCLSGGGCAGMGVPLLCCI